MSIALGGCLKGPPVEFGLTEDTGGHITYVLGAALALASRADVASVEIVTRLIDEPTLGAIYAQPVETVAPKLRIVRLATADRRYLSKEDAARDLPAFRDALIAYIESLPRLPDVIHAHFADAGAIARAVRDRFGIPFIYTAHSLAIEKATAGKSSEPGISDRIAREDNIIGAADAIVASSRDEAERQLMLYPSACPARIHQVTPGAALKAGSGSDPERARSLIEPFLRDTSKPIILAIARPVEKKNLAGLIDLYAQDASLRARANLVILAGLRDGPDSGETEQQAVIRSLLDATDRHDLYGSIALPKRHSAADVGGLYDVTRESGGVFVNPAFTEPYGLTLTEAAAHGLPVVATKHGGAPNIVELIGHGLVADPRDPAAFASAIRKILDDDAMWQGFSQAGLANSAGISWDAYAERLVEVVRGLIERPARPVDRPTRLLLCDIDNTVTGCRAGAAEFADFLAADRSIVFGVATGRSLQEAHRLLREWRLPKPAILITSVGSEIYWQQADGLVADKEFQAYIGLGWKPEAIRQRLDGISGLGPQPPVEQRRYKLSYFASEPSVLSAVRDELSDLDVHIVHSHSHLLDILPARAGKGAAMVWAARKLGIPRDRVYAAGDSGNDLDMLATCRNPILVANHSQELKDLLHAPQVYVSRRPHAGGIIEGMQAHARRIAA